MSCWSYEKCELITSDSLFLIYFSAKSVSESTPSVSIARCYLLVQPILKSMSKPREAFLAARVGRPVREGSPSLPSLRTRGFLAATSFAIFTQTIEELRRDTHLNYLKEWRFRWRIFREKGLEQQGETCQRDLALSRFHQWLKTLSSSMHLCDK